MDSVLSGTFAVIVIYIYYHFVFLELTVSIFEGDIEQYLWISLISAILFQIDAHAFIKPDIIVEIIDFCQLMKLNAELLRHIM